jgi:hypothetical protein
MPTYNISCTLYESKDPLNAGFEKDIDVMIELGRLKMTTKSWNNITLSTNIEDRPYMDYSHKALKKFRDENNYPYYTFKCTVNKV